MQVLLPIHPRPTIEIFNGVKQYEYRKHNFTRPNIEKVIVYETFPMSKIVGEFTIDDIICDTPDNLWLLTHDKSGISERQFRQYFHDHKKGYAIKIKTYHKYDKPLPLSAIKRRDPPQSLIYLPNDPL